MKIFRKYSTLRFLPHLKELLSYSKLEILIKEFYEKTNTFRTRRSGPVPYEI